MNEKIINTEYIFLNIDIKSKEELFSHIANNAYKWEIVKSIPELIESFKERETLSSTALGGGFAIPHARNPKIAKPAVFVYRFTKPIVWDDENEVEVAIVLLVPEGTGTYLDILSGIATKLMSEKNKDFLKKCKNKTEITSFLISEETKSPTKETQNEKSIRVVGVTACATGVVHTYIAREAILDASAKMDWFAEVETQGQKGPEFILSSESIKKADVVILANDIAIDTDRFIGKKIYKVGTKPLIEDPVFHLRQSLIKSKEMKVDSNNEGTGFDLKDGKAWIRHIMSGISFMIPFIVFAVIVFAIVTGIGKLTYGTWLDYSGKLNGNSNTYVQSGVSLHNLDVKGGATWEAIRGDDGSYTATITINSAFISILYYLNQFANIGFGVMIPVMGAYIANSIGGRSAITPAFILTSAGTNPSMWWHWGIFHSNITSPMTGDEVSMDTLFPSNGGGIFAALLFGFLVGHTVKWINTKWKVSNYLKPIMPIIIIPVFVTLIYGIFTLFLFGNIFGLLMGYFNYGLQKMENSKMGMAALGLVLGLIAGIDMGGPINKIASFGATALIPTDGGKAMGCAAAAFAIAPLGAGICSQIFRKKFKQDQALGVNATILGFMGISEGAIPFAAKYTWAAFLPNIICSGVAGMLAGMFHVSGWVGAWGGPIIALFGGVTTWEMSYIGVLWYLLAIVIATTMHVFMFRFLVEIQSDKGQIGSVKKAHIELMEKMNKDFINEKNLFKSKIMDIKKEKSSISKLKKNKKIAYLAKNEKYNYSLEKINIHFKELLHKHKVFKNKEKSIYKKHIISEKIALKANNTDIKNYKMQQKKLMKQLVTEQQAKLRSLTNVLDQNIKKTKAEKLKTVIQNAKEKYKLEVENYISTFREPSLFNYNQEIMTIS